jgi:hypothetical protein
VDRVRVGLYRARGLLGQSVSHRLSVQRLSAGEANVLERMKGYARGVVDTEKCVLNQDEKKAEDNN